MQSATRDWLDGLRESVLVARGAAETGVDGPAAAAERMILAAHLATWLDATPALLESRRVRARACGPGFDPDAALVITTSPVGIVVASDVLGRDEPLARDLLPRVVCVTERHYREWCMRHPDHDHRLHVNHWSWVKTRVPPQRDAEFAAHPLRVGERYWLHRCGTAGAGAADGRAAHLWKFDGLHASLLEAFVAERHVDAPGV